MKRAFARDRSKMSDRVYPLGGLFHNLEVLTPPDDHILRIGGRLRERMHQ